MRRRVQILGLIVLALAASGWGHMLAASLCPHMSARPADYAGTKSATAPDASCHQEPEAVSKQDCHDSSAQQQLAESGLSSAYAEPVDLCAHCVSRPETPVSSAIARTQTEQKRNFEPPVSEARLLQAVAIWYAPRVTYRQGAPPGSPTPKHLLIGLLLI